MNKSVATLPVSTDIAAWTDEEKAVVEAAGLKFTHTYGAKKGISEFAPRAMVAKFMHTCSRTGLDPLARQIYCIGRGSGSGEVTWSIQTAIDGFRVIAERSGKYSGQDGAQWLTDAGEWVDVFVKGIHGNHPLASRVNVYRNDWPDKPAVGIATWDEYKQTKSNGELTAMWETRGAGQLAKCAEALALRKAFPQDLSGVFTDDEMQGQSAQVDVIEAVESSGIDWEAAIDAASSREDLAGIAVQLKETGEGTDALRAKFAAKLGMLDAEANTRDGDEVTDDESGDGATGAGGDPIPTGEPGGNGTEDQPSE